jgi:hypothetical protein
LATFQSLLTVEDEMHFRNLFSRQPSEKTQLDDATLLFIQLGKPGQRVVQCDNVRAAHLRQYERRVEFYSAVCAALGGTMAARVVHQNLPHQARGHGEKMCPVLSIKRTLVNQPQVSLVD